MEKLNNNNKNKNKKGNDRIRDKSWFFEMMNKIG